MGKHSKDHSPTAFGLPGDFHLIAQLKIESEEEAVTYLTDLEKEMLGLPRSKHSVAISWRIKAASDALRTDGLESAMSHLGQIPHLRAAFIKEERERKARIDLGKREKFAKGIMSVVEDLVRHNPKMTAQQAWDSFPQLEESSQEEKVAGKLFEIFRDGNVELFEYEIDKEKRPMNRPKIIKRRSFDPYLKKAKASFQKK